jgi:hypothetical protein
MTTSISASGYSSVYSITQHDANKLDVDEVIFIQTEEPNIFSL